MRKFRRGDYVLWNGQISEVVQPCMDLFGGGISLVNDVEGQFTVTEEALSDQQAGFWFRNSVGFWSHQVAGNVTRIVMGASKIEDRNILHLTSE